MSSANRHGKRFPPLSRSGHTLTRTGLGYAEDQGSSEVSLPANRLDAVQASHPLSDRMPLIFAVACCEELALRKQAEQTSPIWRLALRRIKHVSFVASVVLLLPISRPAFAVAVQAEEQPSIQDVRLSAQKALDNELPYFATQRKWVCTYQLITREYGPNGRAVSRETHTASLFATDHATLESDPTGTDSELHDSAPRLNCAVFGFPTGVLKSVIAHSVISDITVRFQSTSFTPPHRLLTFRVQGNTAYMPSDDPGRIGNSLVGFMTVDLTDSVITVANGVSAHDVVDGSRFIMLHGIPVLNFGASQVGDNYFPDKWSAGSFPVVPNGFQAGPNWTRQLIRTFGTKQECKLLHAEMKIVP